MGKYSLPCSLKSPAQCTGVQGPNGSQIHQNSYILNRNIFFPIIASCESESDETIPVSCYGASSAVNSVDFDDSFSSSDG